VVVVARKPGYRVEILFGCLREILPVTDAAVLFDNSGVEQVELAKFEEGRPVVVRAALGLRIYKNALNGVVSISIVVLMMLFSVMFGECRLKLES